MQSKLVKKIAGLTIMELLVSIIIATFIVGVCFMVLNLVSKNVFQIQKNYDEGTTIDLFKEQLAIDLHRYPNVAYSEFKNELVFKSPIDSVTYAFEEAIVIREKDTIAIAIAKTNFYFLGNTTKQGSVDALKIQCKNNPATNTFFLSKENDAMTYLTNGN